MSRNTTPVASVTGMRTSILACTLALSAASLSAQFQTFTSPYGFDTTEGNTNHDYILFSYNKMRWQQMDSTAVGTGAKVMRSLAWRRDSTSTARSGWIARSVDITLILAEAQPIGATSIDFNANYAGTPTTVFTTKTVQLPDWTAVPPTPPAAFDVKLTFDVPWVYFAVRNFLWEVRADNNTGVGSGYGNDFQTQPGTLTFSTNPGTALGTGCVATGRSSPFMLTGSVNNYATAFRITMNATNGPANAPAALHLDVSNANLTLPSLCTTIYALPLVVLSLPNTNAGGDTTLLLDNLPFNAALVGTNLYFQAAALDAGIPYVPAALTNGRHHTVPTTPVVPGCSRIYEYLISPPNNMRAPSSWTGGMIAQFEY